MNVGRTLRHARRRARLTQRELATRAGVPQSTVARIERGVHMPRVDTFEHLLEACGMDIELTHKRGVGVDVTQIQGLLRMTPHERVAQGIDIVEQLPERGSSLARTPKLLLDDVLAALDRHAVRFIIVGGQASRVWGSPSLTEDFDAAYAPDRDNHERLAAALREMDAKVRVANVDEDLPLLLDATTLERSFNLTFRTPFGDLDFLGLPAGVDGYDELEPNAVEVAFGKRTARVAALDDLIRMKVAAGRPKDRVEVEILVALRDERDRQGRYEP
jgi:transcriptional regulator with XRE-family HTH domain